MIATGMTRREITRGVYTATWIPGENKIDVWTDDGSLVDTFPICPSWVDEGDTLDTLLAEILDEIAFGDEMAERDC